MLVAWPYNVGFLAHALLEQEVAELRESSTMVTSGTAPTRRTASRLLSALPRASAHRAGSPERVEELLQVGETARLVPRQSSGVPWRSWAAEGLRLLDRADEAHTLAAEELVLARRWGDPHAIGNALRVLGLVDGGRNRAALEAVEVLAGSESRLEHARALVDSALPCAERISEPRHVSGSARASISRDGSARSLAERANDEIAATGARPRKVLQTGIDALTASERRVAQLAAEGMSNKEIAQALFVTIKTVSALEPRLPQARDQLRAELDTAPGPPLPALTCVGGCSLPRVPLAKNTRGAWGHLRRESGAPGRRLCVERPNPEAPGEILHGVVGDGECSSPVAGDLRVDRRRLAIVTIAALLGGSLTTEGHPTNNPESERAADARLAAFPTDRRPR